MYFLTLAFLSVATSWLIFTIASATVVNSASRVPCQTVLQYVKSAYFLNVGEQLRGADQNILLFFFNKSIEVMLEILEEDYSSMTMSDVCLRKKDLNRIKNKDLPHR